MDKLEFSLFKWQKNELIFIASVLIILLVISVYQLRIGEMKTRDAQRKADIELVQRALVAYYADYEVYPPATDSGEIVSCGSYGLEVCGWGESSISDVENVIYLKKMPRDPLSLEGRKYVYVPTSDLKKFRIYTSLEYNRDPALKSDLTVECDQDVQCNWYVEK